MTFTPLPPDIRSLLRHLDNHGLLAHVRAACELLAERGVPAPSTLLDELAERIIEDIGRTPGGLDDLPVEVVSGPQGLTPPIAVSQLRLRWIDLGLLDPAQANIRPHVRAAHAGVPLRLVTSEGV